METSLTNERHEAFAQALAQGKTQAEAFRLAYPRSENWKPDSVWSKASVLAKRPEVRARVEYLKQRVRQEAVKALAKMRVKAEERTVASVLYTLADAMREADEALQIAKEKKHAGWITQAVKLRAQLMGLLVERREVRNDPLDLDRLSVEQLRQVRDFIRSALDGERDEALAMLGAFAPDSDRPTAH